MSRRTAAPALSAPQALSAPAHARWPLGPSHPRLGAGVVHVWRAELPAVSDHALLSLSPEERAQADRFARPAAGRLWASTRGVLRDLLARYTDVTPATIAFCADRRGKPALAMAARVPWVSFNVSHSGELALYAFSQQADVGVDVQVSRLRRVDVTTIAARAFGEHEARRIAHLPAARREHEFLRAWTRYEAALKCHGASGGDDPRTPQPWVAQLDMGPTAAGAVALGSAPAELCCWAWNNARGG